MRVLVRSCGMRLPPIRRPWAESLSIRQPITYNPFYYYHTLLTLHAIWPRREYAAAELPLLRIGRARVATLRSASHHWHHMPHLHIIIPATADEGDSS